MTTTELPVLRWGIVGCGLISSWFVGDLCLPDRPGANTKHIVQAVASSSKSKGSAFVSKHCPSEKPTIYDSYQDLYNDPNVDVVYVGTPHTVHLQNTLDAIAAGKHVLCEKPIAVNARDAKKMIEAAREKGVFLMEALWTRFFPITTKLHSLLYEEKVIGDIATVFVDFGLNMPIGKADPQARVASKSLGAGALLDIGIYSMTWASLILDKSPHRQAEESPSINATMTFHDETLNAAERIDEQVTAVLKYPDIKAQAVCSASLLYKGREEFARIEGSKGSIAIGGLAPSKPGYLVIRIQDQEEKRLDFEVPGFGFHYEADAVAKDIRAGRLENEVCSWSDTLTIMSRLDAIRSACGLTYSQDG
ncbi:NAD(P)-binding protein [Aaosphaeria arxii CBS 175.79]|uniref:D-xylose 1-dehydrogenase (NADP(+), D-xylono-1,5-lactone-forming) n=1 Tax=Aaosphaeria arxii CBS 175.79 TaxID=1450172 RepID=A0A6A5Y6I6_9PLEO|nr:NAD(P)-binding protein [Aaosphaeria arxii CBS 175.79]KAF2020420.1 NAD(P)-binding protein [Aaosphaeria arxii CBS 175.79]